MSDELSGFGVMDLDPFIQWYAARHLRQKGRSPSAGTLHSKRSRVAAAAREAGCDGVENLAALLQNRECSEALVDKLLTERTSGTVRQTVYALMDFAEWAKVKGLIQSCALTNHDLPPPNPQRPITVYSDAEIELMVAAARGRDLRWWAFITFLADSGRRVGEALSLHWSWFHLEEVQPFIELPHTKNGTQQYVPLGSRLREVFSPEHVALLKQIETQNMAHANRSPADHPFPWQYGVCHQRFQRFCAKLGVDCRGFHNFRHTKATDLLARGAPMQAVSRRLGHASVATTDRIYNHATALSYSEWVE